VIPGFVAVVALAGGVLVALDLGSSPETTASFNTDSATTTTTTPTTTSSSTDDVGIPSS